MNRVTLMVGVVCMLLVGVFLILHSRGGKMNAQAIHDAKGYCEALASRIKSAYKEGPYPPTLDSTLFGPQVPYLVDTNSVYDSRRGHFILRFVAPPTSWQQAAADLYVYTYPSGSPDNWGVSDIDAVPRRRPRPSGH